jgi:hypothetical protein
MGGGGGRNLVNIALSENVEIYATTMKMSKFMQQLRHFKIKIVLSCVICGVITEGGFECQSRSTPTWTVPF